MKNNLRNKHILLGITGSIAAYKSAELVRRLREAGAIVRVAMTENAQRFITPLTMQAVSGYPVHTTLFDVHAEAAMGHIELARWADLIIIAPASADFIARLLQGQANNLLTTLCLASVAPIALAPAMNQAMWSNLLTQQNIDKLQSNPQLHLLAPGQGSQACGDIGPGRMMEPNDIVTHASSLLNTTVLSGLKLVMTAGPTHEAIDPVRFITNGSSGKMGYALAQAAQEAGADVTLISGPTNLQPPDHIATVAVTTALDMHRAVMAHMHDCDMFISVAAVSDYRSESIASHKIHKTEDAMTLTLVRNPDIVADVAALHPKPFIVGFAAETEHLLAQANAKLQRKKMDMIIANLVGEGEEVMGGDYNSVLVLTEETEFSLPLTRKTQLARELIQLIAKAYSMRVQ